MSISRVTTTNVNMDSDSNYRNFIRVYNNVFPLKVEQEYVNLANLVLDYIMLCNDIKNANREVDENLGFVGNLVEVEDQVKRIKTEMDTLYAQMQNGMTSAQANELVDLARSLTGALKRKEQIDVKNSNKQEKLMNAEAETERLRAELQVIMTQISEQLATIMSMNVNGVSRLDNLSFEARHDEELKAIKAPEVDPKVLTGILARYFNMRKTLFKAVEDFASRAVVEYQHRNLLETGIESDIFHAVNCLCGMTIEDDYISKVMNSAYMEFLNNGTVLMNDVASYFKYGMSNLHMDDTLEEWVSRVPVDYETKECYLFFAREMKRRIAQEKQNVA